MYINYNLDVVGAWNIYIRTSEITNLTKGQRSRGTELNENMQGINTGNTEGQAKYYLSHYMSNTKFYIMLFMP